MEPLNISPIPSYNDLSIDPNLETEIGTWESTDDEGEITTRKVNLKERRAHAQKRNHRASTPPIHYQTKVDKALSLDELLKLKADTLLKEFPSSCDSISQAQGTKYIPSTPDLEEPTFKGPIEKKVIESLEKIRNVDLVQQNLEMEFLAKRSDDLVAMQHTQLEHMQKNAERISQAHSWSLLHAVADGLVSAFTILAGCALAPASIGFFMIGLGTISLANLAFSQLGIWDRIAEGLAKDNQGMQNVLKVALPAVLTFVCMLLGPMLLANGMVKLGFSLGRDLPVLLETTIAFVKGITTIGSGISTMQVELSQADIAELQQKITENSALAERVVNFLETKLKELDQNVSKVARILKLSTRMQRKIARIRG